MQAKVEKLPKSTIKLTVVVPSEKVRETYEQAFDNIVKEAEIPGFRKGMAPKEMVKEKTDVSKVYGDIINQLLQTYYTQAVKENHVSAVSNPKVEIKEFDLGKDFEFVATVAVKPEVEVDQSFKKDLKSIYDNKVKEAKKQNEEKLKAGEQLEDIHIHLTTNEVIDAITKNTKTEFSDLIIQEETDKMMSRLIDQAQSIGLSLDQYLKSMNKTGEDLRKDYEKIAETNIKSEFALANLIQKDQIEVTDTEIEEMAAASGLPDALERLQNPMEKWYIKNILEKNKLIVKLAQEAEGENYHDHK